MRHILLLCLAVIAAGCEREPIPSFSPTAAGTTTSLATPASAGWPCYLGPAHNGMSYEEGLIDAFPGEGPRELWKRTIGTSYSSPIVNEQGVVVFYRNADREIIECLDPATGDSRWTFDYETHWECKYDYSNGPYGTPTIDGDVVYAVGAEGKLHALRMSDGSLIWKRDLNADFAPRSMLFCIGSSPLIQGDRLFFTLGGTKGNSGTICLDKHDGTTIWTATDHAAGYATPVAATIHGRDFLFVFDDVGLVALARDSGAVYWTIPFRSKSPDTICATSPLVYDDMVLVTLGPGPGALCVGVLPDGGYEELWSDKRALDSTWNNLVQVDGKVFGYTSKRSRSHFRCLDFRTGKVHWSWESELERGSVMAADGKLICFGEQGHLALLSQSDEKAEVLSMTTSPMLPGPCYPMPALHAGRLYLKNNTTIACYRFQP